MPGEIVGRGNPLAGLCSDADWAEMAGAATKSSLMLIMDEAKTPPASLKAALIVPASAAPEPGGGTPASSAGT